MPMIENISNIFRRTDTDAYGNAYRRWRRPSATATSIGTLAIVTVVGLGIGGAAIKDNFWPPKAKGEEPISGAPTPVATPTPSAAAGTPRPTEIVEAPNFGVRYNPSTGKCDAVDKDTGKAVDISNSPIERVSYQETGVGVTKTISTILKPGQTAIIQGWKVDGKGDGVFKAVVGDKEMEISFDISDGAVEVYGNQDAYLAFCRAVEIAVDKGYAHERVEIPETWKITQ